MVVTTLGFSAQAALWAESVGLAEFTETAPVASMVVKAVDSTVVEAARAAVSRPV
jgi:hypothetical protein